MEGKGIAFACRHTSAIVPPNTGIGGNAAWKGILRLRRRQQGGGEGEGLKETDSSGWEMTQGDGWLLHTPERRLGQDQGMTLKPREMALRLSKAIGTGKRRAGTNASTNGPGGAGIESGSLPDY